MFIPFKVKFFFQISDYFCRSVFVFNLQLVNAYQFTINNLPEQNIKFGIQPKYIVLTSLFQQTSQKKEPVNSLYLNTYFLFKESQT